MTEEQVFNVLQYDMIYGVVIGIILSFIFYIVKGRNNTKL